LLLFQSADKSIYLLVAYSSSQRFTSGTLHS
jgi:hypothetical protein